MTTLRQKLALLLALTTLALTAASCASDSGATTDTSADTTVADETTTVAETYALDTLPTEDFGGATFSIVSDIQDNRQTDFVAEEENGDTLNDLVYRRNSTVEDRFNITIEASGETTNDIITSVQTNVAAGDNPYDLLMPHCGANTLAYGGQLLDWSELDAIDLSQPWWDQNALSGLSVGGRVYMIAGDISPNGLLTSECILFNKQLFENREMEEPYDMAFDGTWTYDVFAEMSKGLTEDLNGDGVLDDKNDLYSYTLWNDGGNALFWGMGAVMSTKDDDDYPVINYQSEKLVDVYTKIYNLINDNQANYSKEDHEQTWKVFIEGRAYFCGITFQKIGTFLRNMENDFGVMPIPKYDESQEKYMTNVSPACTFAMIARTTEDTHFAGTIVEALAAASYDTITPTLYDVIAGVKNVRDEESPEVMNMIIRNRIFDPACLYYLDGYMFVRDLLVANSPDVVSHMTSLESAAQAKLDSLIDAYEKIG